MNLDYPRWGVIGVAFTLVTAFAGILITLISISDGQLRLLGSFVAIISIIVLVVIFWKLRVFREVAYQIISNTSVLKIEEGEELKGRIQVLLDNTKPLRDARIVVLKIWNSGTMTIRQDDYYKNLPLIINFGKDAEVLETEILDSYPKSLKTEVETSLRQDEGSVLIEPIVLEKNNFIMLKTLLTKFNDINVISFNNTRIIETPIVNWETTFSSSFIRSIKSEKAQEIWRTTSSFLRFSLLILSGIIIGLSVYNPILALILLLNDQLPDFHSFLISYTNSENKPQPLPPPPHYTINDTLNDISLAITIAIAIVVSLILASLISNSNIIKRYKLLNFFFNK